jgi:hypothetical protein
MFPQAVKSGCNAVITPGFPHYRQAYDSPLSKFQIPERYKRLGGKPVIPSGDA